MFFVFRNSGSDKLPFKTDSYELNNFIDSCLQESLIKSFEFYGVQGLVYNESVYFGNLTYISVPYIYYLAKNRLSSYDSSVEIIKYYTGIYFEECINNFSLLKNKGYIIKESGGKEFSIDINQKEVLVSLKYPLSVDRNNRTFVIEKFEHVLMFDFNKVHKVLSDFVFEQNKTPDKIPPGYLGMMLYNENISAYIDMYPENNVLYIFVFNDIFLNNNPFIVMRMVHYNKFEPEKDLNILNLTSETAFAGTPFNLSIHTEVSNAKFTDYTTLFDITPETGLINFVPVLEDIGTYDILIKSYNKTDEQMIKFKLEIVKNETT